MSPSQTKLIVALMSGHFLVKSKKCYTLYDAKVNPLQRIRFKTVDKIDQFIDPKMKLWKENKRKRITLNLNTVRQLHGKNMIKRIYNGKAKPDACGPIYKQRARNVKTFKTEQLNLL